MSNQSKMICRKSDNVAVMEIFPKSFWKLNHLNTEKYYAINAQEYLANLSKKIKEAQ